MWCLSHGKAKMCSEGEQLRKCKAPSNRTCDAEENATGIMSRALAPSECKAKIIWIPSLAAVIWSQAY